ncbi:hypothetical protein A6U86_30795 [Rhizobium sp. AC27/96]|uniref:hypothetical protein n=1 Tax=Rhizobium sp. AC27/96 TaxID=1841653 RepID=UPI000827A2AF|nr:hypothetical protein [Rhizobium sp. AC27/96]OCJ03506.1 hypothetical protein A6U86_30795 [Rhizobium sp. AC27/96]
MRATLIDTESGFYDVRGGDQSLSTTYSRCLHDDHQTVQLEKRGILPSWAWGEDVAKAMARF